MARKNVHEILGEKEGRDAQDDDDDDALEEDAPNLCEELEILLSIELKTHERRVYLPPGEDAGSQEGVSLRGDLSGS